MGDFKGLHIDLERVWVDNIKKLNELRKNNCIINTGDNITFEQRKKRIISN